jgi:hypothetical protein
VSTFEAQFTLLRFFQVSVEVCRGLSRSFEEIFSNYGKNAKLPFHVLPWFPVLAGKTLLGNGKDYA